MIPNLKNVRLRPEAERKAHMEAYARVQKIKLKVTLVLSIVAWAAHGFPLP